MSIINLLPDDYLQQRSRRRVNVLCMLMFAVVMTGVVAAALVSQDHARRLQRINEEVNLAYRKAGESITEVQQLQARKEQVLTKARSAATLLERVPRSYLLGTLTNALPAGASLGELKLQTTQPKQQKATKSKTKFRKIRRDQKADPAQQKKKTPLLTVKIEVTGMAETDEQVAQFIGSIRECPLMRSVELIFSEEQTIDEQVIRQFQVTMELVPHAEVELDAALETEGVAAELASIQGRSEQ